MTRAPVASDAAPRTSLSWSRRVLVAIGIVVLRALMRSWRLDLRHADAARAARAAGTPYLLAFWHGRMLGALAAHRYQQVHVVVSEHRDGELIARVLEANGCHAIRGSTSRGGARALLQVVAALKAGQAIGITPDGPRGPRHSVAPGLIAAAQRSGAPIIPIAVAASRGWQLGSWDGFEIPAPFARVVVQHGEALHVAEGATRDLDTEVERFRASLDAAQRAAEQALGR